MITPAELGGVPDFQFDFGFQGDFTEGGTFHTDVAPFLIFQPRHVITGADMDIFRAHIVGQHAGNSLGLGNLLGFQPLALQHVHEIGVAAEIELVAAVQAHAAVDEQAGQARGG